MLQVSDGSLITLLIFRSHWQVLSSYAGADFDIYEGVIYAREDQSFEGINEFKFEQCRSTLQ